VVRVFPEKERMQQRDRKKVPSGGGRLLGSCAKQDNLSGEKKVQNRTCKVNEVRNRGDGPGGSPGRHVGRGFYLVGKSGFTFCRRDNG